MQKINEFTVDIDSVELGVVEWEGDSDPILLLHATGFHSRCWHEVIKGLPGQHIYAVDLRFHGRSGAAGDVSWPLLAQDIRLLIEKLDLTRLVGVGHSIGGHLIARAAAALPERFKQTVLIDPVIMSPHTYAQMHDVAQALQPADHPVSRRKNRWRDADEMFHRFEDRMPFCTWQPQVLRDYCDYALQPVDDADYHELACDPINEASIYLNQMGNDIIHAELPRLDTPVTLLRAPPGEAGAMDLSSSPTWPELASVLPCCREVYLPELNHFIPMQAPELVADYIRQAQIDAWQTQED